MSICSDIFLEIDGESVSDRRIRYWKWQRRAGKRNYAAALKSERVTLTQRQMSAYVRRLISQVETLSQRVAQLEGR
jgi:hypothetical protein